VEHFLIQMLVDGLAVRHLELHEHPLVAHALAHRHPVVTHEVAAPSIRKIEIPNARIGVGIRCMTPNEMLRLERARFVLGRSA
jgi:hypothetical protein